MSSRFFFVAGGVTVHYHIQIRLIVIRVRVKTSVLSDAISNSYNKAAQCIDLRRKESAPHAATSTGLCGRCRRCRCRCRRNRRHQTAHYLAVKRNVCTTSAFGSRHRRITAGVGTQNKPFPNDSKRISSELHDNVRWCCFVRGGGFCPVELLPAVMTCLCGFAVETPALHFGSDTKIQGNPVGSDMTENAEKKYWPTTPSRMRDVCESVLPVQNECVCVCELSVYSVRTESLITLRTYKLLLSARCAGSARTNIYKSTDAYSERNATWENTLMHVIMWWARACDRMTTHQDSRCSSLRLFSFTPFGSCLSETVTYERAFGKTTHTHTRTLDPHRWTSVTIGIMTSAHTYTHAQTPRDHIMLASNARGCTCSNKSYVTSSCRDTVYGNNERSNDSRQQVAWKSVLHDTTCRTFMVFIMYNVRKSIFTLYVRHTIRSKNLISTNTTQ